MNQSEWLRLSRRNVPIKVIAYMAKVPESEVRAGIRAAERSEGRPGGTARPKPPTSGDRHALWWGESQCRGRSLPEIARRHRVTEAEVRAGILAAERRRPTAVRRAEAEVLASIRSAAPGETRGERDIERRYFESPPAG